MAMELCKLFPFFQIWRRFPRDHWLCKVKFTDRYTYTGFIVTSTFKHIAPLQVIKMLDFKKDGTICHIIGELT